MSVPGQEVHKGLILYKDLTFGKKIGAGGFGVVYKGTYRLTDVAIKALLPERLTDASQAEFEKEAEMMRRCGWGGQVGSFFFCFDDK